MIGSRGYPRPFKQTVSAGRTRRELEAVNRRLSDAAPFGNFNILGVHMGISNSSRVAFAALTFAILGGCAGATGGAGLEDGYVAAAADLADYQLGPADKIRLIVYGEPDLSGEFAVSPRGQISLPLLGEVAAAGFSIEELQQRIVEGLSDGFVVNARVAAEVIQYRPYYILGEVGSPGEYPYSSRISAMKAIAAAGGFTYRAKKSVIYIKRADRDVEAKYKLNQQLMVFPGDVVRVGERFF